MHNIFENEMVSVESYKVDADNETINGAGVDTAGYEGVCFLVFAGRGEVASWAGKAQQDTASDFGSAADLAGTAQTFASAVATDGFTLMDIRAPQERYVRSVITAPDVGTARPVVVLAVRYGAKSRKVTNAGEQHYAPAEGTA
jgi:hypothetical protein